MVNGKRDELHLEWLATRIRGDLAAAGLPIVDELDVTGTMAGVEVQTDVDEGIHVSWRSHFVVTTVARHEHARLQKDGPGARFDEQVCIAMRAAMATILRASGYVFDENYYGDYTGYALWISGHEEVPSWRDWHEKQRSRLSQIQYRLVTTLQSQQRED